MGVRKGAPTHRVDLVALCWRTCGVWMCKGLQMGAQLCPHLQTINGCGALTED
jgi:hypothetical protein